MPARLSRARTRRGGRGRPPGRRQSHPAPAALAGAGTGPARRSRDHPSGGEGSVSRRTRRRDSHRLRCQSGCRRGASGFPRPCGRRANGPCDRRFRRERGTRAGVGGGLSAAGSARLLIRNDDEAPLARHWKGGRLLPPSLLHAPCGEMVVCIPARNEAQRLPRLIASLDRQRGVTAGPLGVVVLLNNCNDGSRAVVERAGAAATRLDLRIVERSFPARRAHAGSARNAAMEAGAAWIEETGAIDGVLLTTDADATPADDWIARSLATLDAGADVAASAIIGDPSEEERFSPPLRAAVADRLAAHQLAIVLEDAIDPVPGDPRLDTGTIPAADWRCGLPRTEPPADAHPARTRGSGSRRSGSQARRGCAALPFDPCYRLCADEGARERGHGRHDPYLG